MQPGIAEFLEKNSISGIPAYSIAAIAVVAFTALRLALNPVLGDTAPYALQAVVLMLVASFAGYGPSLFALVTALVMAWFFIPPYDLSIEHKIANQAFAACAGTVMCVVTSTMRAALISAVAARRDADFLGLEMHHRVKNLFAVVASMITLAARDKPGSRDVLLDLRSRLQSLADAHDVAIDPTDFVSFPDLLDRLLAPHMMKGSRVEIVGDHVELPPGHITPLGLIINELATNSAKHGALAEQNGKLRVHWIRQGETLAIHWKESGARLSGAPREVGKNGFGSLLINASIAQLHGSIERELAVDGLVAHLSIPLTEATQNMFLSDLAADRQTACDPPRSSLSALPGSRRFFPKKPRIRDSRS
jgi:two-component sensor histidine kinase